MTTSEEKLEEMFEEEKIKRHSTAIVHSLSLHGLECSDVEIEVDVAPGLPSFIIVGLPDTTVNEARDRVRSAIKNSGFDFPRTRVTVNLAPAHTPKEGSFFDLPIALGILAAAEVVPEEFLAKRKNIFIGELALDGRLRPVRGALPLIYGAHKQRRTLFLPTGNKLEAELIKEKKPILVSSLSELVPCLKNGVDTLPTSLAVEESISQNSNSTQTRLVKHYFEMVDIRGQMLAKRALEIAAAGGHNVLLIGPPGSGKSMLAKALPSILPHMTDKEILETSMIYSVNTGISNVIIRERPFRAPHHTSSTIAVVGGGTHPQPGEISLAHNGVLYLDEIPEFRRDVLEALRQPLEEERIRICRSQQSVCYPANFMFVASMNPCPCGYYRDKDKECQCSFVQIQNYQRKLSGPLLDRIDMIVQVPRLKVNELIGENFTPQETSQKIRSRVEQAREKQRQRFSRCKYSTNSRLPSPQMKRYCELDGECQNILARAMTTWHLSPRAYFRTIKTARTIADLADAEKITPQHITEALHYRVTLHQQ